MTNWFVAQTFDPSHSFSPHSRPCIIFKKEFSRPSESGQCGGNRSGESKSSAVTSIVYIPRTPHHYVLVMEPILRFLLEFGSECG